MLHVNQHAYINEFKKNNYTNNKDTTILIVKVLYKIHHQLKNVYVVIVKKGNFIFTNEQSYINEMKKKHKFTFQLERAEEIANQLKEKFNCRNEQIIYYDNFENIPVYRDTYIIKNNILSEKNDNNDNNYDQNGNGIDDINGDNNNNNSVSIDELEKEFEEKYIKNSPKNIILKKENDDNIDQSKLVISNNINNINDINNINNNEQKLFIVNGKKMNSEEYQEFLINCIIYAKKKIMSLENQNLQLKNTLRHIIQKDYQNF